VTSGHVHVGEGGEKDLENSSYTFSFHVGLKLIMITLVFFCIETSLVEEENPFSFYNGYQNLQHSIDYLKT
jgi:hypothetical protein